MLEQTIRKALKGALADGCDDEAATVFAVCAVLAEKPDLALQTILKAIEEVRRPCPAGAL